MVDSIKDITARNPHAGIFEFSTLLLNPDSVQHPTELVLFVKRTGDEKLFAVLCSNIGDIRGENGIYTLIRYPLGYNPIKDNYLSTDGKTNEVFPALVKLTSDILNYPDFSI